MTSNKKHRKVYILGSGPAGYTAAIYAARAGLNPGLISGLNKGGQLNFSQEIENWPGDIYPIAGSILMERMNKHALQVNTIILDENIIEVNLQSQPFKLISETDEQYTCDALIVATGATARYLGIPSESEYIGKGVSACATCDGFLYRDKVVAVIGGGNTAIQDVIYLHTMVKEIHLIHRKNLFKADKILVNRLMNIIDTSKKIHLHMDCCVEKIIGNGKYVNSIYIKNIFNNIYRKIMVSGVFIAIGHIPNSSIFINQLVLKNGYIVVQSDKNNSGNVTATSVPGVFAAGDVVDTYYRQAITAAGSGCMAALDAKYFLEKV